MSAAWQCLKIGSAAIAHIIHLAPWMLAAYIAAHPLPTNCWASNCHFVIPRSAFLPGGMFGPPTRLAASSEAITAADLLAALDAKTELKPTDTQADDMFAHASGDTAALSGSAPDFDMTGMDIPGLGTTTGIAGGYAGFTGTGTGTGGGGATGTGSLGGGLSLPQGSGSGPGPSTSVLTTTTPTPSGPTATTGLTLGTTSPIPEPSSLTLLVLALLALFRTRRRPQ